MQTSCPNCQSANTVRNGKIHTGKQRRLCKDCERQFVEEPTKQFIPAKKWELVDKLLLEKLSIAGIVRVTGISETWIYHYLREKYAAVPRKVTVTPKKKAD